MSQSLYSAAAPQLALLLSSATEFLRAGQPANAIEPLREAALLQPSDSAIQHDLGLACLEAGLLDEAIAALQRAVSSNPRHADAYFRLGIAREKLGDVRGAILAYNCATELTPAITEAWFRAGALVYTLSHAEEAIDCFLRAAATGANTRFGRLGKARALLAGNHNVEAEVVLRQTIESDPDSALAHDLLGNLLTELGRFDEARACFERAISIAPLLAGSFYDLVRCRPVTRDDDDLLEEMQRALSTPGLEDAQRLRVHLAIGKASEDLGDYALAMWHFDEADAVRRKIVAFDSDAFSREIDRLIDSCTPEWMARCHEFGSSDEAPVLIIGMPRSGTTLVEQIISMHPEVGASGELNFWNDRGLSWFRAGSLETEKPFFAEAVVDYLAVLRGIAPAAARVTDKMPFNFLWANQLSTIRTRLRLTRPYRPFLTISSPTSRSSIWASPTSSVSMCGCRISRKTSRPGQCPR
jgi:tetratricopeptide (TPR) repeat protein